MLGQVLYVSSSGIVADGNYTLLATSSNHYIPRAIWIDKPSNTTVKVYDAPSGVAANNSNTFLAITNTNAAMVYFDPIGVSGVSLEVSSYAAGRVNATLYYQISS